MHVAVLLRPLLLWVKAAVDQAAMIQKRRIPMRAFAIFGEP
jgi:hypothetical protein